MQNTPIGIHLQFGMWMVKTVCSYCQEQLWMDSGWHLIVATTTSTLMPYANSFNQFACKNLKSIILQRNVNQMTNCASQLAGVVSPLVYITLYISYAIIMQMRTTMMKVCILALQFYKENSVKLCLLVLWWSGCIDNYFYSNLIRYRVLQIESVQFLNVLVSQNA